MNQAADAAVAAPDAGRTVFGQPLGLATLFLTEMWERFTYYGMRALLILFMAGAIAKGGLGIADTSASAIYGLYLGSTYLLGLAGGWMADRLLGAQRAVIAGGCLITAGNVLLAVGNTAVFFIGLLVIAMGVGLLKPNVSALVATLYPEGGARRDAGFSIFYMGINFGAFIGSLAVPLFAQWYGWRWGFFLPAVGMALGVAQFLWTRGRLGPAGLEPAHAERGSWTGVILLLAAVGVIVALLASGALHFNAVAASAFATWAYAVLALAYFGYLLFFAGLTPLERNRTLVMAALFAASVMFWAGYEQQGASFNLFAERYTDRHVLGWNMPAGVLQAVNPFFVISLAGAFVEDVAPLTEQARGADALVVEATFLDRDAALARARGHLTAAAAAGLARAAGVGELLLTHISGRYRAEEIAAEAAALFPNTRVVADFDRFSVGARSVLAVATAELDRSRGFDHNPPNL